MSEKKTGPFEEWLSANSSFRFHAHGGEPQIDKERARIRLLERINHMDNRKNREDARLCTILDRHPAGR